MEKIEFKPAFITSNRFIALCLILAIDLILSVTTIPQLYTIYRSFPHEPGIFPMLVILLAVMIIAPLAIIGISINKIRNHKIWIEKNLIYFLNKSSIGSWGMHVVNLDNVTSINHRRRLTYFAGLPKVYYWLLFHYKNGKKDEIPLEGWDENTLKNIVYYLKGKYHSVKYDTHVYRDSSAILSGVHEFLQKHKKTTPAV